MRAGAVGFVPKVSDMNCGSGGSGIISTVELKELCEIDCDGVSVGVAGIQQKGSRMLL